MIALFLEKIDDSYVLFKTGKEIDSIFEILKSSKNIYQLYALYIEDIIDLNETKELHICHMQIKKLVSLCGMSYGVSKSQYLDDKTLNRVREKIMKSNINIIYNKDLNNKFKSFMSENINKIKEHINP